MIKVLYAPKKRKVQSVTSDGKPHVLAAVVGVWGRGRGVQSSGSGREGEVGVWLGVELWGAQEARGWWEGWVVDNRRDGREVWSSAVAEVWSSGEEGGVGHLLLEGDGENGRAGVAGLLHWLQTLVTVEADLGQTDFCAHTSQINIFPAPEGGQAGQAGVSLRRRKKVHTQHQVH